MMLVFVLVCAVIQCLCLVPFIQRYIYEPTCDACNGDTDDAYPGRITRASRSTRTVDPVLDYLDACIQFSYFMMFTVVRPLLALPAFVNNILEVQGDAFRLRCANRRPMPRRDTSIVELATVLAYANIIGVTVVSTPSRKAT
ncbi:hypothetical protein PsorP6_002613 [Peronosclerospora sorghi]|uniref:Uncharacterized protein n=1 Tax=Peronosclerospora sorghi TaxID=230839 RepID=A0ACC0WSB1_9STRA|nr:hypothetical protein PsorP6_002613 [Peronosclerospora sorghi]